MYVNNRPALIGAGIQWTESLLQPGPKGQWGERKRKAERCSGRELVVNKRLVWELIWS